MKLLTLLCHFLTRWIKKKKKVVPRDTSKGGHRGEKKIIERLVTKKRESGASVVRSLGVTRARDHHVIIHLSDED